jgi:chromosome segregation ATPase
MTDRIDKLRTLLRLRQRDIDRRTGEVAEAARAVAAAEAGCKQAEARLAQALRHHEEALAGRIEAPCDPLVGLFCERTETALVRARERLAIVEKSLHQALEDVSEKRRQLLRAQARNGALETFLSRALRGHRRAIDRRLADDRASDFRPAMAFA